MPARIYVDGLKYGRLLILEDMGGNPKHVRCRCDCGIEKTFKYAHIQEGRTKSCGCLHKELASERASKMHDAKTTHGLSGNRAYAIWCGMKQRCGNPKSKFYSCYGGRGIKVCEKWLDSFEAFISDMGFPPRNHTIDRINNNGNYEPTNCRWASRSDQQSNRRVNRLLTFEGRTQTATQWADELSLPRQTIFNRISQNWPIEKILSPDKFLTTEGLKFGGIANGLRQRQKTHCKHGHEFSEQNTSWYKGARRCKPCHASRQRQRLARLKTPHLLT